jgi:1,4-dihydroxy-2-naphthoate octaprenyltransferase
MSTSATSPANPTASWSSWLLAVRPKTLPAAVSPVLVGCAVAWAEGEFAFLPAVAAFAVALLLQIAANLVNDVADFRRGVDTPERLGPVRVTQSGLISADRMVMATIVTLAVATIPGLYLVWRGGPLLAVLGMLAILAAVAYTAGPKPFGYLGLGEAFVFFFFGPVAVVGTNYVMTRQLTPLALAASVPIGCLVTAILVVNNLRDIETDRRAGKRTLAVRLGAMSTRWEFIVLLIAAYAVPPLMWISKLTGLWPMLALTTIPFALLLVHRVRSVSGRALNPVLGGTARLALWFAITFSTGIIL